MDGEVSVPIGMHYPGRAMRMLRVAFALLLVAVINVAVASCRTSSTLGTECSVDAPNSCGDHAACVSDGVTGRCVRAYATAAELRADAVDNVGKTVLVRSLSLARAPRLKCTSKYLPSEQRVVRAM